MDRTQGRLPTISSHQGLQEPLIRQASDTDVMPDGKNMDHTPGECLRSVNFWLLWVANGVASGAGLTLLNNLGQQVTPDPSSFLLYLLVYNNPKRRWG